MAEVTKNEIFACSLDNFYKIIKDYEKYPLFLSEISHCAVIGQKNGQKLVEYQVHLIRSFTYQLWMTENDDIYHLNWELAGGAMFKSNKGYWNLEEKSGQCSATFHLNCQFKMFIPNTITKTLLQVNLPNMMKSYHKRVNELYGQQTKRVKIKSKYVKITKKILMRQNTKFNSISDMLKHIFAMNLAAGFLTG